jgi:peptide/nickel transport system substrate-binding protein/oligopeptide transport system substrate-binding protein
MRIRQRVALIMVPITAALGLVACGSSSNSSSTSSGTPNPNGIASIGIAEPQHLIPSNASDVNANQVLVSIFAPLVTFDPQSKPIENQAASITTKDAKVWDIKLKPGYTFSNGEPVTADNYINAWNYGAYAPNGQANNYYYANIDGYAALNPTDPNATPTAKTMSGLKKVSDTEFQVTLSTPYIDFEAALGYTAFLPLPKAAFTSSGALAAGFEDNIVGDGAFMVKGGWQHDKEIDVVKYGKYPGQQPKVGGIDFKIFQDLGAAYSAVQGDQLDVLPILATQNLATAQADFGSRYKHSPMSSFTFVAFPTYEKQFSNVNVRKAISMAIDRDAIVRTIFDNAWTSARSFVSPVLPGYRPNVCGAPCVYNPAAAKAMYQANGGPPQLTITYNADGPNKEWVEATCNQLQQNLSVPCLPKPVAKFADLVTQVQKKTQGTGMFRLGWVMDYPSMSDYLGPLYSTNGSSNYYGYSNKTFDNLVIKGNIQTTQEKAIAIYQQAEGIIAQDLPVIPMFFGRNNFVFSRNVNNVSMDLFQNVDVINITTTNK